MSKKQNVSLWRRHPKLSSRAMSWMLMAAAVIGGGKAYQKITDKEDDNKKPKTEQVRPDKKTTKSDGAKKSVKDKPVKRDTATVHGFLSTYWNEMAIGLTELETYMAKPKILGTEVRATCGPGLTWRYLLNNQNEIYIVPLTETMPALSYDKNYEQMAMHLNFETLRKVINATNGLENITDRQKIALVWAAYQRPRDVKLIVGRLKKAKTQQQIADAFTAIDVDMATKYRNGTLKRRWICGAYAAGVIDIKNIMGMQRDAFSVAEYTTIGNRRHFKLDTETVKYVLSCESGKSTVREFLSKFPTGKKIVAGEHVDFPHWKKAKEKKTDEQKKTTKPSAKKGNVKKKTVAKTTHAKTVSKKKDSVTEKKSKSKKTVAKATTKKADKKKQMAKPAAKKDNVKKENKKSAKKQATKTAKKNAKPAVTKKAQKFKEGNKKTNNKKQKASAKKQVNKKRAFNDAAKKLGNNAHSAGFDLSELVFGGHDMA